MTETAVEGEGFQIEQRSTFGSLCRWKLFRGCSECIQLSFDLPAWTLFLVSHSMSSRVSDHLKADFRVAGFQHYTSITSWHTLALFAVRLKFLCC